MPARRRYEDAIPAIPPAPPLSRPERHLRIALLAGALLFAVEAAIYVPEVLGGPPDTRPFGINSVAKDVLFAALTALAAVTFPTAVRVNPQLTVMALAQRAGSECIT
jgi:hypothetical protein